MKINNCKLCEIYDDQKLSDDKNSDLNSQSQFCRHSHPATFLSQTQLALAFHLLRGYYQPAGPLISPHLLPPPPSLEGDHQNQQTQQSSGTTGDNVEPDVMITGELTPRPPYRYGPPPPGPDFSRPLHPQQMHYPPTYPPYYYGQHPPPPPVTHQDLCYPYYPPKYFPTNSPYTRRPYVSPGYYQPPPLVPQNAPQQIVPAAPTPQHIDPHYSSSPYYPGPNAYNASGQCYSQTPPRNLQPPYLDSQYHSASCPCPMQSCQSKNVHTGTGPTKAKGPVSASNGMADSLPKTSSQSSGSVQPTISCKIENLISPNLVIKPESDKLSTDANQNSSQSHSELFDSRLHPTIYSMHAKIHDTPDLSPSPSRGSIGIQQMPTVQHEATVQHTDKNLDSDNASISNRKQARIGKSMERDRQATGYYQKSMLNSDSIAMHFRQEYPVKKERDVKKEKDCEEVPVTNYSHSNTASIKVERPESDRIQSPKVQNDMSTEYETATVNLANESSDECGIDYSIKRKRNDNDDVIELSDNSTLEPPQMLVKRRKLLEKPISTPKKSPPNSYKSLIKQSATTPETVIVPSSPTSATVKTPVSTPVTKPKLITRANRSLNKQNLKRKNILKSKSIYKTMRFTIKAKRRALQKKKQLLMKRKRALAGKENDTSEKLSSSADTDESTKVSDKNHPAQLIDDDNDNSSSATVDEEKSTDNGEQTETSENIEDKSMDGSSEYSGKSNIDLTIDRVAKGYFSESEIFSSLSKHRKTKSQKRFEAKLLELCQKEKRKTKKEKVQNKGKLKSLHVKKKITKEQMDVANPPAETSSSNKKTLIKKPKKTKAKEPKEVEQKDVIKESKKKKQATKKSADLDDKTSTAPPEKDALTKETDDTSKRKHKVLTPKKAPANKKTKVSEVTEKTAAIESPPSTDDTNNEKAIESKDTSTSIITAAPTTAVKSHLIDETDVANNNDEYFENNNNKQKQQQEPLTLYKTPGYGWTTALVKASRRGKKPKYTNRKKLRLTLPNDIVIPKSTSIPRWSNGWVWEGEPYQALVFLNSDDPPVPRTCYDAMRHEECGDVIRPRDCVLLKAGGKRNELPYVAKVAQLWESPEDGEMMMSLFWYYRPEHTEQGRQNTDALDEVFASRHKDHNSVACIEDKCYVITYNEYCRYRKMLRSVEENIEQPLSLVPKLPVNDRRLVPPPNTSPELVMFCRRVYDFRGKRLMEDKKKK